MKFGDLIPIPIITFHKQFHQKILETYYEQCIESKSYKIQKNILDFFDDVFLWKIMIWVRIFYATRCDWTYLIELLVFDALKSIVTILATDVYVAEQPVVKVTR